jgi:anthraniloyl-CoA monooxygenase
VRIAVVGGGPAGLCFSLLAAQQGHDVRLLERLGEDESPGWGVVFWDALLGDLARRDPPAADALRGLAHEWRDQRIVVRNRGEAVIPSVGYSVGRHDLLDVLHRRAREVGVVTELQHPVRSAAELEDADLVVAADGVNSAVRDADPGFGTSRTTTRNRFIWLGTTQVFDTFTFPFVQTEAGWLWAHAYAFSDSLSTFIVEMSPETWAGLGFDRMDVDATMRRLEQLFAPELQGHRLQPRPRSAGVASWLSFPVITNRRWYSGRTVLLGDAAHTTHFTIGSGTRLALEDALELVGALEEHEQPEQALAAYSDTRRRAIRDIQRQARYSARWFEHVPRYVDRSPRDFTDLLERRRSPLVAHLPVGLSLQLAHAADHLPGPANAVRGALRRVWR